MKKLSRKDTGLTAKLPIKVIQFGEGNFLRGFVDYAIDKLNENSNFNAGVTVIQPLQQGLINILNEQEGLYTLFLKGIKNGKEIEEKRIISCIQNAINPYEDYESYLNVAKEEELTFVISNTTEAGISFNENDALNIYPHQSFPAKVTALLYKRFQYFKGAADKGLFIIPCELINHNADNLKEIILKYSQVWKLGEDFKNWILNHNSFHNTLVDRIVPGYPKDTISEYQKQLDFKDSLIVSAEIFFLWVIEGDEKLKKKIPFEKIEETILIVKDMQPYRTRKVRILNGAHTAMVPLSILYGNQTVKETLENTFTGTFIKELVFKEIIPTLNLPEEELIGFANQTFDRFKNPFIKHQLESIALNSISKFKVRVLPSLIEYQEKNKQLPPNITFAFACLMRFYKGEWNNKNLPINDEPIIESSLKKTWELVDHKKVSENILNNEELWETDLTQIPQLKTHVSLALEEIENKGIEKGYKAYLKRIKHEK